ncbi:hypothetical protein [Paracoccus shandongensis]|uniref:hypothetical protein n=1 Tax=Paracoccus shandongensis TaxID=2816048 RepID=UPI001A8F10B9|nr:hypothetical protein [Paracoccus shandongensis]
MISTLGIAGFRVICADSDTGRVKTLAQRIALGVDTGPTPPWPFRIGRQALTGPVVLSGMAAR